jgi:hypothetical protein
MRSRARPSSRSQSPPEKSYMSDTCGTFLCMIRILVGSHCNIKPQHQEGCEYREQTTHVCNTH